MNPMIGGRQRRRLEVARQKGYLDATCPNNSEIARLHGLWCWRLRIPFVWFERRSARSRYGRLHLEMMTTSNALTGQGQAGLRSLANPAAVSAYSAEWELVPLKELDRLAHLVCRVANRTGCYRPNVANDLPRRAAAAA